MGTGNGKKKGSFLSFFFFIFFFGKGVEQELRMREVFFFSSFYFSFVSFLPFLRGFSLFFRSLFVFGSRNEFCFLSFWIPFYGKEGEDQLEKFEGNSSSFSFLFSLFFLSFDPSSFQFLGEKMSGNGERWEDKNVCPHRAKKILQEHYLCTCQQKLDTKNQKIRQA